MRYLKRSKPVEKTTDLETRETVSKLLQDIERGGESVVRSLNESFDDWRGDVLVSSSTIDRAVKKLPQSVKDDLKFAHQRVNDFAHQQRESMHEFESELSDGLIVGQKLTRLPPPAATCQEGDTPMRLRRS